MADDSRKPDARPLFRRLASGVAVVCFILAAVFAFAPIEGDVRPAIYVCLAVGVVMAGIALTGNWSWWGRGSTGGTKTKAVLSDRVKQIASDPAKKIEAIKIYREETGAGLAEAKEAVEAFINRAGRTKSCS